jgi:hypothetical protein
MVDAMMLAGILSPAITKSLAGFWARNELSRFIPMNVSTCISNVAGPDFPLYCAGAKMVDYYGLGVLTPGMGIFHLVFSYSGKLTLSVLADRAIMPDPEFYHDCLEASYDELYGAAVPQARGGKSKTRVTKTKGKSPKRKAPAKKKAKAAVKSRAPAKRKAAAKTTVKAAVKSKAPAKRKTPAKAKAKAAAKSRAPAKRKTPAKAKAKAAAKRKAPAVAKVAKARPKATRRAAGKAKPKLKA